jgi:16S rRNA (uracil1498-N3)-methyltransferase
VNLFYQPLVSEGTYYLDEEESRHCIKVLRKHAGETINLTDGKGSFYEAVIKKADTSQCTFEIVRHTPEKSKTFTIHVGISPTKNTDRIEWFVEKSVEIGIDEITLIECKNSERAHVKLQRLQKVAISAMKQSVKATLPKINAITAFDEIVKANVPQKFIAHVDITNPVHLINVVRPGSSYLVLVGPEGDFTTAELESAKNQNFIKVSLGESRLRTETAGVAACHILSLVNRSQNQ